MNWMNSTAARALILAAAPALFAPAAWAQSLSFDIPSQGTAAALTEYSRQASVQIAYPYDAVRGHTSQAVRGAYSRQTALQMLIRGTGLQIASDNGRTVALKLGAQPVAASTSEGDESPDASFVEEIVVTAQKKVENIQDVPASISVIGGQRLETLGATQLSDYAAYVPGLIVDGGGTPGQTRITLRGLSPINSTTMVGTYVDDSPLGSSAGWVGAPNFSLDLMPYDIERIEVLRGPQGTLYGANTMGGLLKYVTRAPSLTKFSGRIGAEATTIKGAGDLGWGVRGSLNAPLVQDKLGVSVSVFDQVTPGYIDNGLTGAKDENEVEQKGARIALLWQATDALSVKLSAMGQDIDSDNNAIVSLIPGTRTPIYGDLKSRHFVDQPFNTQLRYYTGTVNWDLGWADFVSASSYATTKIRKVSDATRTYGAYFPVISAALPQYTNGVIVDPGLAPFDLSTDVKKFTQEFRLSSPASQRLEWLLGAFYTKEDALMTQILGARDINNVPVPGFEHFFYAYIPTSYKEAAVFGNATFKFTDAFDVSFGARFARNDQGFKLTAAGPFLDFVGASGVTVSDSKEDVFTYSIAPRWHISDDTMVYARVASGYRPGGPNSPLSGIPPQVNSDRIVNYEVGLKSEFLDRRAMVDVAVFRVNWDDIQAFGFHPSGVSYLTNGGKARSQGVEFNASYAPVRGMRLGFNTAYTDAKLIDPIPSIGGVPGDQLAYTPKWSGAVTADYEFPLGEQWTGQAGGGIRYIGKRQVGFPAGSGYAQLAAYTAIDLHAGVSNDRWGVRVFIKNAADKRAYLTPSFVPGQVDSSVLQPRTIGVALEAKF
jgi:iron complex outermembrane receptor protein